MIKINMEHNKVLEQVIDILSEFTEIDKDKITENSELIGDMGLNSLDVINIVVAFEDEYGIEIQEQKIKELVTVKSIVDLLMSYD